MGRQSSRIYFKGKDHKGIYFDRHYHDKMYIGSNLVWERAEIGYFAFEYNGSMYFPLGYDDIVCEFNDGTYQSLEDYSIAGPQGISCPSTANLAQLTGDIRRLTFKVTSVTKILTPFPKTMRYKTSFSKTFSFCQQLTSIPENLFANCSNVTDFTRVFDSCRQLTSIPENLFANCSNVKRFYAAFDYCTSLTSIPENLFADCLNVTDFESAFGNCNQLTSIPENLFANCPNVTDFSSAFIWCTSLTSIPENLFANCPNVKRFYAAFSGCRQLTSIPENLFANCPNVTDFYGVFSFCTSLTSIPENLFANCPNVTDFSSAFVWCENILSAPKLWLTHPNAEGTGCYQRCTKLPFYDEIPDNWK